MISVVTLHWKRTDNTYKLINSLKSSKLVNDVIVWNNNKDVTLKVEPWVRLVNTSQDFGLNTRFGAALYAKNNCILTIDDDNIPTERTIRTLFENWKKEPKIIHSLDGRRPTEKNEYAHDVLLGNNDPIVEAPMSMTRCAMYHKDYAAKYFITYPKLQGKLKHSTDGNGEDIMLSFIASNEARKNHKIYRLPRMNLPEPHAIHGRTGHKEFRTKLMRSCQAFFT